MFDFPPVSSLLASRCSMSSALVNGVRRALAQRARAVPVRSFNTSAPKRGGDGEPVRTYTCHTGSPAATAHP